MPGKIEIAVKSDVGRVRTENQDHFCVVTPEDDSGLSTRGALVVVADGMGGHSGGTVASHAAIDAFEADFSEADARSMRESLCSGLTAANDSVREKQREDPAIADAGTTCVSVMVRGERAVFAHLGDSRAYMVRGKVIELVTRDHTYLNELIDIGLLTEEQALTHPDRNIITRCVGMSAEIEIDYNQREIGVGDAVVLCSDGLTNFVRDDEIAAFTAESSPKEAVEGLVDLANERGGEDNITVAILRVMDSLEVEPELAALDADESQFSSKMTPVIRREELEESFGDDVDPDAETKQQRRVADPMLAETVESSLGGRPLTTAQSIETLMGDESLDQSSEGSITTRTWYWIIGAEILALVILHFFLTRF